MGLSIGQSVLIFFRIYIVIRNHGKWVLNESDKMLSPIQSEEDESQIKTTEAGLAGTLKNSLYSLPLTMNVGSEPGYAPIGGIQCQIHGHI